MTWRRAFTYVSLAAVLAAVLWATTPAPPPVAGPAERPRSDVVAVAVEARGRRVEARREGERWRVTPAGATSDLVDALLAAILDAPAEPLAGDASRHAEFGLDAPTARVVLTRAAGAPVTLVVGADNPAGTGIYGQLEGNPQVVLMGRNVRYYIDLLTRPPQ
jgi:hypothetical protein